MELDIKWRMMLSRIQKNQWVRCWKIYYTDQNKTWFGNLGIFGNLDYHYILWSNLRPTLDLVAQHLVSSNNVGTISSAIQSGELVAILLTFLLGFIYTKIFHLFLLPGWRVLDLCYTETIRRVEIYVKNRNKKKIQRNTKSISL